MEPIHRIRKFIFDNSLNFNVTTFNVEGVTRRLHATWSPELAQDLQAYHGIDAEAELTRMLSEHIRREFDREIINNITQDITTVQPLSEPQGRLFYFDFQYEGTEPYPNVYGDGSWSIGNHFEGSIGFKIEILPHKFI